MGADLETTIGDIHDIARTPPQWSHMLTDQIEDELFITQRYKYSISICIVHYAELYKDF